MSQESKYLKQCIDLTTEVLNKGVIAYINIKVGEDFVFTFNNQEYKKEEIKKTRSSPSQIRRNRERKENLVKRNDLGDVKQEEISENLNSEANEDTIDAVDEHEEDKESLWMDCWDPDVKWSVKDVKDHLEETLATVFKVFKVKEKIKNTKWRLMRRLMRGFQ